jgi:hypothetical protein
LESNEDRRIHFRDWKECRGFGNLLFTIALEATDSQALCSVVARAMSAARVQIFHATFIPPLTTTLPYVVTFYGSETLERPDFYPLLLRSQIPILLQLGLSRAIRTCCVSDYSSEYVDPQGISSERIALTLLGCDFESINREVARRIVSYKCGITRPYILYIGIEPRKNPLGVIEAYSFSRQRVPNSTQTRVRWRHDLEHAESKRKHAPS